MKEQFRRNIQPCTAGNIQNDIIDNELFRSIMECATDAIISIDKDDNILLWNNAAVTVFGFSSEEAVGKPLTLIMPERFRQAHHKGIKRFFSTGRSKVMGKKYEVTAMRRDGREFPIEISLSSWEHKGQYYFTGIIRDITKRKEMEGKLLEQSITDELTGLLNRRGFITLAEKQHQIARRYKRAFSILFLDLNEMKTINDQFGHHEGDQALTDVADILKKTFRSSDIIARLGGDEFTALITEPKINIEKIIVNHIHKSLKIHNDNAGRGYELSVSTGFAHFDPEKPKPLDELLSTADELMYENKKQKNGQPPQKSGKKEMRRHERRTGTDHSAELIVPDTAMIRNISIGGICLKTSHELPRKSVFRIKLKTGGAVLISPKGEVLWSSRIREESNEVAYESGLKFIDMSDSHINQITQFISAL